MTSRGVVVGDRFGRLTAIEKTGDVRHSRPVWLCQCDCGNQHRVVSSSLLRGFTKSCGCLAEEAVKKPRAHESLVGRRFGHLVVVSKSGKKWRGYAWECACDCGQSKIVAGSQLKNGHTQSCGCLTKKAVSRATSAQLIGQRFGRLLVLSRDGSSAGGGAQWLCRCDCGATRKAVTGVLTSGRLISCGCANIDRPGLRSEKERAKTAAQGHKRRAAKRNAGGSFTAAEIDELYRKQRGCCAGHGCGVKLGKRFHRDHIVALANGGTNDIGNIQLLCKPCNLRKNDKDPIDWAQQNGRLL